MSGSGHVNASPEGVLNLASALEQYQRQVAEAGRNVQRALAGADWNDPQKARFEAHYRELQKQTDRFLTDEVSEMVRSLKLYARKLDDIRRTRM